jgi:predicted transcriptional regulator
MKINVVDEIKIKGVDLRAMRQKTGVSLKTLEKLSGVNYIYLSLVERGKINVVGNEVWEKIKKGLELAQKDKK